MGLPSSERIVTTSRLVSIFLLFVVLFALVQAGHSDVLSQAECGLNTRRAEVEKQKQCGDPKQPAPTVKESEDLPVQAPPKASTGTKSADSAKAIPSTPASTEDAINVIITFANATQNPGLQQKFGVTVSSMLRLSSVNLIFYIIGNSEDQDLAEKIMTEAAAGGTKVSFKVQRLNVDELAQRLHTVVTKAQKHFSAGKGSYFYDAFFFSSIAIHRVFPESITRVVMLDADLKFKADIRELYAHFDQFKPDNVIGIADELQPVYRRVFRQFRNQNAGTRIGEPRPNGLPGFNGGVLLLDLKSMRESTLYNWLLTDEGITQLVDKYKFKGNLANQDFFSLIGMEFEDLFFVLGCEWNRQLCTWWRDRGYQNVFDEYHKCDRPAKIYHGNCNATIPND